MFLRRNLVTIFSYILKSRLTPLVFRAHGLIFRIADSDSDREEVYKLRYEVYVEKGYIDPFPEKIFSDTYDSHSIHLMAIKRGIIVGSVRLIHGNSDLGFPTERVFTFQRPSVKKEETIEVSSLTIRKDFRGGSRLIMMGLMKEMYKYTCKENIKHAYFCTFTSLVEYVRSYGIVCEALHMTGLSSEAVEARNMSKIHWDSFDKKSFQPYLIDLEKTLNAL